jgi:hypothetical protein
MNVPNDLADIGGDIGDIGVMDSAAIGEEKPMAAIRWESGVIGSSSLDSGPKDLPRLLATLGGEVGKEGWGYRNDDAIVENINNCSEIV